MSKPCPCYGPCLAGDDRCPLIAPDPVAALLRHERDSLATQLDDAKQAIVTFRATMEQMRRERDARPPLTRDDVTMLINVLNDDIVQPDLGWFGDIVDRLSAFVGGAK